MPFIPEPPASLVIYLAHPKTNPDYVVFASGGNDSVALVAQCKKDGLQNVIVAYSNTGWAAPWWPLRIAKFKLWVEELGFTFVEIPSEGMLNLVDRKMTWPKNKPKFCTFELKIKPAQQWLETIDPEKQAICLIGIRREESEKRRQWPLWIESSESHGGRSLSAPLVFMTEDQRNALLHEFGWAALPYRSKECSPCVNANRADFRMLEESDIRKVEDKEKAFGLPMFRPKRFMNANGIREVIKWAISDHGKYEPPDESGCDSGMCGD